MKTSVEIKMFKHWQQWLDAIECCIFLLVINKPFLSVLCVFAVTYIYSSKQMLVKILMWEILSKAWIMILIFVCHLCTRHLWIIYRCVGYTQLTRIAMMLCSLYTGMTVIYHPRGTRISPSCSIIQSLPWPWWRHQTAWSVEM